MPHAFNRPGLIKILYSCILVSLLAFPAPNDEKYTINLSAAEVLTCFKADIGQHRTDSYHIETLVVHQYNMLLLNRFPQPEIFVFGRLSMCPVQRPLSFLFPSLDQRVISMCPV